MTAQIVSRAVSPAQGWRGARFPVQVMVLTGRSVRSYLGEPQLVLLNSLQPVLMLVLFSQIFGGMLQGSAQFPPGVGYLDYLLPAIMTTTGVGSAIQSGSGLVNDLANGMLTRFRSLPVSPAAVLAARSLGDLVRTLSQLVLLLVTAVLIFGARPAGGVLGIAAAMVLALVVSWPMIWVFLALASWLRSAEALQAVGFVVLFPLMFASSAYVPLSGLPEWLRIVAQVNPLTYAVDAARGLAFGDIPAGSITGALIASGALFLVSASLALRGFRRPL